VTLFGNPPPDNSNRRTATGSQTGRSILTKLATFDVPAQTEDRRAHGGARPSGEQATLSGFATFVGIDASDAKVLRLEGIHGGSSVGLGPMRRCGSAHSVRSRDSVG
jgi:hypothetical protein